MKNIVCAFVLTLLLNSFYSQNTNITSLNSDRKVNIGLNLGDILRTSGPNNYRKSFDLVELNARYMINNRVGIKFDIAYDKFEFPR